jgi:hypothetical protein
MNSSEKLTVLKAAATENILGVDILDPDRFAALIIQECNSVAAATAPADIANSLAEQFAQHLGLGSTTIPQQLDLEMSLYRSNTIIAKVRMSSTYAQNLYAALCNNEFVDSNNNCYSVSWRYAGGIVASLSGTGDYLGWYCSGMTAPKAGAVPEGTITQEIERDLAVLGWTAVATQD